MWRGLVGLMATSRRRAMLRFRLPLLSSIICTVLPPISQPYAHTKRQPENGISLFRLPLLPLLCVKRYALIFALLELR